MSKSLFLAPEAIFPISVDEEGKPLSDRPATGFSRPGTLQGEGKLAGIPVLFVRTSGCNLRCMWTLPNGEISLCDTPLASFHTRGEKALSVKTVKKTIQNNLGKMNHLVISGGEPFIQAEALTTLISELKQERNLHVSVETNGTLFHEDLCRKIDFFSISPKLANSLPTPEKLKKSGLSLPFLPATVETIRVHIQAIQAMIDACKEVPGKDFQLKFVIAKHHELREIENDFLDRLTGWAPDDVILMPLGSTPEELEQTRMLAIEAAIERGWRYSPRLQINYFGGIAGV